MKTIAWLLLFCTFTTVAPESATAAPVQTQQSEQSEPEAESLFEGQPKEVKTTIEIMMYICIICIILETGVILLGVCGKFKDADSLRTMMVGIPIVGIFFALLVTLPTLYALAQTRLGQ